MASKVVVKDQVWKDLRKKLIEMRATGAHVRVGVLAGAGGEEARDGITMLELAAIHEFGSPAAGIPERSFIRATFTQQAQALRERVEKIARAFVADKVTLDQALGQLGAWAASEVKKTIRERRTEGPEAQENAPSTIARKGSSTPLVDTGRLLGAVSWLVQR